MNLDGDWYWKSDDEVGMGRSSRLKRNIRVWTVLLTVVLAAAVLAGWLVLQGIFDFLEYLGI
ncbi:hypothetical protein H70357_19525 [Paenibacillus sp. FSL H7-0357]|uniref:hypothetical protein n=1 Tax=unclassified Paenibacillus TaxID=185978 RepID=UPI0004F8ECD5|nr:hypothetical protein [Paenibacillus sp. FSL H7-0357]AIQ18644.1 hypothetical protein H70357_19525 [Paenibacillus sp. FSL H7-0357]